VRAIARDELNDAQAYYQRGLIHYSLGDEQEAINDFNHALKIDPNYAYDYYNRGNTRYESGDKQGAIADFQKAANLYQ